MRRVRSCISCAVDAICLIGALAIVRAKLRWQPSEIARLCLALHYVIVIEPHRGLRLAKPRNVHHRIAIEMSNERFVTRVLADEVPMNGGGDGSRRRSVSGVHSSNFNRVAASLTILLCSSSRRRSSSSARRRFASKSVTRLFASLSANMSVFLWYRSTSSTVVPPRQSGHRVPKQFLVDALMSIGADGPNRRQMPLSSVMSTPLARRRVASLRTHSLCASLSQEYEMNAEVILCMRGLD